MKLTKKHQQELAYKKLCRMSEIARILRERRKSRGGHCSPQYSFKVAKRFVAIYGVGQ